MAFGKSRHLFYLALDTPCFLLGGLVTDVLLVIETILSPITLIGALESRLEHSHV